MITEAAIKFRGINFTGKCHAECFAKIHAALDGVDNIDEPTRLELINGKQGFVTDEGIFLDRAEALKHVIDCGQDYYPEGIVWNELYSEHLYPGGVF